MTTETKTEAPAETPIARIVSTKERERAVPIVYEVEFNGTVYEKIVVRRITGSELEAYFGSLDKGEVVMPPGVGCPPEVWNAMDADDQYEVEKAAMDFLPQKLKVVGAAVMGASSPASSENTQA